MYSQCVSCFGTGTITQTLIYSNHLLHFHFQMFKCQTTADAWTQTTALGHITRFFTDCMYVCCMLSTYSCIYMWFVWSASLSWVYTSVSVRVYLWVWWHGYILRRTLSFDVDGLFKACDVWRGLFLEYQPVWMLWKDQRCSLTHWTSRLFSCFSVLLCSTKLPSYRF